MLAAREFRADTRARKGNERDERQQLHPGDGSAVQPSRASAVRHIHARHRSRPGFAGLAGIEMWVTGMAKAPQATRGISMRAANDDATSRRPLA